MASESELLQPFVVEGLAMGVIHRSRHKKLCTWCIEMGGMKVPINMNKVGRKVKAWRRVDIEGLIFR